MLRASARTRFAVAVFAVAVVVAIVAAAGYWIGHTATVSSANSAKAAKTSAANLVLTTELQREAHQRSVEIGLLRKEVATLASAESAYGHILVLTASEDAQLEAQMNEICAHLSGCHVAIFTVIPPSASGGLPPHLPTTTTTTRPPTTTTTSAGAATRTPTTTTTTRPGKRTGQG